MSSEDADDVEQLVVMSDSPSSPSEATAFFAADAASQPASLVFVAAAPVKDATVSRVLPTIVVQAACVTPDECVPLKTDALPCPLLPAAGLKTPQFSPFSSTQSGMTPACRICQCFGSSPDSLVGVGGAGAAGAQLISPCHCTGTLQYVHPHCLRKWLETRDKAKWVDHRDSQPPQCELCGYTYRMRKRLRLRGWQCPTVTTQDKVLHTVFFICILLMGVCGAAAILWLVSNGVVIGFAAPPDKVDLSREEIVSVSCGIGFFVAVFVALAVQIKAKRTICRVCTNCIEINKVWFLTTDDSSGRKTAEVALV